MPAATSTSLPGPATFAKMEDRKRPALSAVDDLAPPSKRQAVNGGSKSKDDSGDAREEAWIEEYQKGAIYRQMLEYKREKGALETRVHDLESSVTYHDDHIRILDAWLLELLQEIELVVEGTASSSSLVPDPPPTSSLSSMDSEGFKRHLGDKARILKTRVESLFRRLASCRGEVKPDVTRLEAHVKDILAQQKEYLVKIDRLETKNATLSEQLDTATLRALKAERKLDRAKSAQVQKLEQQALAVATARPAAPAEENGDSSETNDDHEELKVKHAETVAVLERYKMQIESLLAEVKGLRDENAAFKVKKEAITDEDYARTDLFKTVKGNYEDLIRRYNHLEATNKQLREEAKELQAERTSFKLQLENEAQAATSDLEETVQRLEADLTRIRAARDDLFAEREAHKSEHQRTALAHLQELIEVKDDRISAMESELERLRPSEDATMYTPREDLDAIPIEELKEKYLKLERDFEAINKEMPLLEKAYKKSANVATKKVMDFAALDEKVANLSAEKIKTDQKYFASRRESDTTKTENKTLRIQTAKSSEIVAQLRAAVDQNKVLIQNLEKQAADLRQSNLTVAADKKKYELSSVEATRRADSTKTQISDLTNLVKSKDAAYVVVKEENLAHEREIDKLKARVAQITTDRDSWKNKKLSNSTEEEDMLRKLVLCSVCRTNFKNTVLKGCGHVFCNECVENRLTNRMRKCPSCNKSFDRSEAMAVHL